MTTKRIRKYINFKNPTFIKSTFIAAGGFMTVLKNERKLRGAVTVAVAFVLLAFWAKATYIEVFIILFVWTQVIVGEIFNTSLEKVMDYAAGRDFHPLIKLGKDYAAASVFVLSVVASCISLYILGVRFFD